MKVDFDENKKLESENLKPDCVKFILKYITETYIMSCMLLNFVK